MTSKHVRKWIVGLAVGIAALAATSAEVISDYKIAPLDLIVVIVFQEKDLTQEFKVSAKGEITFPLLNTVKVAGLTPIEVEKSIRDRLISEDFMVDPQVTVAVKNYRQRVVSVFGQVNKPGLVELPAEQKMTVIEAITAAGGFTRVAKEGAIKISRPGEPKPFKFSLDELQKNNDPSKVFYLQPNDVIFVDERIL